MKSARRTRRREEGGKTDLHGLLDRSIVVEPMALKQIDVFKSKSFERSVDGGKDVLLRGRRGEEEMNRKPSASHDSDPL